MEVTEHGLLEELLGPRREPWNICFGSGVSDLLQTGWSFDESPELLLTSTSNASFVGLISTADHPPLPPPTFGYCPFTDPYPSLVDDFTAPQPIDEATATATATLPFRQEDQNSYPSMVEGQIEDPSSAGAVTSGFLHTIDPSCCKVEMEQQPSGGDMVALKFNMGLCIGDTKKMSSKSKKLQGQPSKNLMAERRRRKRLNDRLSMLRSIVPKISKMDRTSILGDTIDYMKELLERINKLQEEEEEGTKMGTNQMNLVIKQNEVLSKNSPKFDVERKETETRIDICCPTRPGLLLSTVSTMEALGVEIQQCVISCFSDFSMHASCSKGEEEQRTMINSDDIKQALLKNAGYGGRCL